jgi:hypothetical protein
MCPDPATKEFKLASIKQFSGGQLPFQRAIGSVIEDFQRPDQLMEQLSFSNNRIAVLI